ncbi:hypothetical protein [Alicyclobacillus sendaiensis]|uniref:Uncharacterized protein n=1 Tax=Alicyclobacillus sendaiensis PA2 TaxID=3029425 RepID=A0ABT6XYE6_ALISE|nr:hypothetical protein [Alicyclobacillus sendaiensis]MDI9260114.1 hypothetical protein [Alicyclobacillus sendaiensis PA2]
MREAVMADWAASIVEAMYRDHPDLYERYGQRGKEKCLEDNLHHIRHLRTCFELRDSQFFVDYVRWLDGILRAHGMQTAHLLDNLERLAATLPGVPELDDEERRMYEESLRVAMDTLRRRGE